MEASPLNDSPAPAPVDARDVGAVLRQARERRGVSLDQVSRVTKIGVTTLRHIEHNQIDKLPNRVFLRGFLSAYAREVGLNADDIVQRYLLQFERPAELAEIAKPDAGEALHRAAGEGQTAEEPTDVGHRSPPLRAQRLMVAAALLLVTAVSYTFVRGRIRATPPTGDRPEASIATAQSAHALATKAPAPSATATLGSSHTNSASSVGRETLRIEIRPQGLCWLSAAADGKRVVHRLMRPGEEDVIELRDEVVLRVGDPAAFAFSIDGTPGRALGRAGEAVTVHITKQNYREFLER
jgi:transcriptional regulator with XRE-family HTH domain